MTELTIKFNYVQDCVVLLREDFLKYTGMILPKEITKGHADNLIKRCRHTTLETERIRPLLFDLLDNIATTKLPNGRYEYCDDNIYSIGTTDVCAEGTAIALIEADCVSDCGEEFVRNHAQKMFTQLINKAIDSSRSYGAFTIKEPEFDITIVGK